MQGLAAHAGASDGGPRDSAGLSTLSAVTDVVGLALGLDALARSQFGEAFRRSVTDSLQSMGATAVESPASLIGAASRASISERGDLLALQERVSAVGSSLVRQLFATGITQSGTMSELIAKACVTRGELEGAVTPLGELIQASMRPAFHDLVEGFRSWEAELVRLAPTAERLGRQAGWVLSPHMEVPLVISVLQAVEKLRSDAIPELGIVAYYAADEHECLRHLVADLQRQDSLRRWHALLGECAAAYLREHYHVAVPALAMAIEGFLAEHLLPPNVRYPWHRDVEKMIAARLETASAVSLATWRGANGLLSRFYQSSGFHGERPEILNRHWVLHGRDDPARWGASEVIRLLTLLDALVFVAADL